MYSTENILEMLREGMTPDDIATQFTESLNQAMAKKAEEEEKLAAAADKEHDTVALLETFNAYLNKHYPSLSVKEEELKESINLLIKVFDAMAKPSTRVSSPSFNFLENFFTF